MGACPSRRGVPAVPVVRHLGAASLEEETSLFRWKLQELKSLTESQAPQLVDFRTSLLESFSTEIRGSKALMLEALAVDGQLLCYASPAWRSDPEMLLCALRTNPDALLFVESLRVRGDKSFMLRAVGMVPEALEDAAGWLRGDIDVVLRAVEGNGKTLKYASEGMQACKDVALTAVRSNAKALRHVSTALQADPEVVLEAVRTLAKWDRNYVCHGIWSCISEDLLKDKDFVLQLIRTVAACKQNSDDIGVSEAAYPLRQSVSWEEFEGVAASRLAHPGEAAPVLSVSLSHDATNASYHCQASMLSGKSVEFSMRDGPH